jgi:hypothetical protein
LNKNDAIVRTSSATMCVPVTPATRKPRRPSLLARVATRLLGCSTRSPLHSSVNEEPLFPVLDQLATTRPETSNTCRCRRRRTPTGHLLDRFIGPTLFFIASASVPRFTTSINEICVALGTLRMMDFSHSQSPWWRLAVETCRAHDPHATCP